MFVWPSGQQWPRKVARAFASSISGSWVVLRVPSALGEGIILSFGLLVSGCSVVELRGLFSKLGERVSSPSPDVRDSRGTGGSSLSGLVGKGSCSLSSLGLTKGDEGYMTLMSEVVGVVVWFGFI